MLSLPLESDSTTDTSPRIAITIGSWDISGIVGVGNGVSLVVTVRVGDGEGVEGGVGDDVCVCGIKI